jgi:hypothetical protein
MKLKNALAITGRTREIAETAAMAAKSRAAVA